MELENVGRRRLIYVGILLSLVLAWLLTPLSAWLAGVVVQSIPLQTDVELGRNIADGFRRQVINDRGALQAMGNQLLRGMRSQVPYIDEYEWKFQMLNDETVNAFACPGGFIFVNQGLRRIATDDELAAVIGHEIGHVVHRHSQQRMVQSRLGSILLKAVLVGDGDGVSEGFGGEVGGILLRSADSLLSLSYSRANEYEADAVAWWATLSAGYSPAAATSFFRKLGSDGLGVSWLSTHPATADRIIALEGKAQDLVHLQRTHSRESVASHFAPALVGSGSATGAISAFFNFIPADLQKKALVGGVAALAGLLDDLISGASSSGYDVYADCEDGESKISFEHVQPGKYVALGHGKCLTVGDLRNLRHAGRLKSNPYTRQPFTQDQLRTIEALLRQ